VTPNVLIVNPDLPVKSVKELIDYARANRATINMASAGWARRATFPGCSSCRCRFRVADRAAQGRRALGEFGGRRTNTLDFTPAPAVMSFIKNGRLRALGAEPAAALGDARRHSTVADTVPGIRLQRLGGAVAPPSRCSRIRDGVGDRWNVAEHRRAPRAGSARARAAFRSCEGHHRGRRGEGPMCLSGDHRIHRGPPPLCGTISDSKIGHRHEEHPESVALRAHPAEAMLMVARFARA